MFDKIREKLSKVAKNEEEEIVFKKLEEDELDLKSGVGVDFVRFAKSDNSNSQLLAIFQKQIFPQKLDNF